MITLFSPVEEAEHIHVTHPAKVTEDDTLNGDSQIEVTKPLQQITSDPDGTSL